MILIFIVTSEVTAQGSRYQATGKYARGLVFLRFSCRYFHLFLSLSLSSYFPFYLAFISYFCFGLAYSLRQAGLFKKDMVKVDFQNSIFQVFFGI